MHKPHHFKPDEAHRLGMPPGWWVMDKNRPVIGPYRTKEAAQVWIARRAEEMTQPKPVGGRSNSSPVEWGRSPLV
ncbi:hypothetical protein GCM10010994_19830 [Chelatococcus reniformis]|uniref:Uncharacterized protein n=1 Tax=Chelatococcus reniformis TaxID=1494448 RepID=A0A916U652_9HYPH|nr:hypothetical protein GCM10010994_19830 [Chelatococcus reniformis]